MKMCVWVRLGSPSNSSPRRLHSCCSWRSLLWGRWGAKVVHCASEPGGTEVRGIAGGTVHGEDCCRATLLGTERRTACGRCVPEALVSVKKTPAKLQLNIQPLNYMFKHIYNIFGGYKSCFFYSSAWVQLILKCDFYLMSNNNH